ncbi:MAG: dihydrodipicolinate synthase family protein [Chloroflexi bacterium]|nr:dihydrodipicolinate synthase family protein [Chloroflexota bacterium]
MRYIVATVTPFKRNGDVDHKLIEQHLEFLVRNGVEGILPGGSNGEFPSLTIAERKRLLETVMKNKAGLWVMAHTSCTALADTIELTKHAEELGANVALVVPPFYWPDLPQQSLGDYYEAILRSVKIPIVVYNIPKFSKNPIPHELLERLVLAGDIFGVKDSSGSLESTTSYVREFPDLQIFYGADTDIAGALRAGAAGATSGLGNAFPALVKQVFDAYANGGDMDTPQRRLLQLFEMLKQFSKYGMLKYVMALAGLPESFVRLPHIDLADNQKRTIREALIREGFIQA